MPDNVAQTVQKVIQDLVAPDLRELKTLVAGNQKQNDHQFANLQKQIDQRFDAQDEKSAGQQKQIDQRFDAQDEKSAGQQKQIDQRFDAQDEKFAGQQKQIDQRFDAQDQINNAQFKALMAAIAEVKAQSDLNTVQAISALSERVAILESRHH